MLRPVVLNTYDRSIAYTTALDTISGVSSLPLKTVTCTSLPSYPLLPPGTPSSITVPATSTSLTYTISWGAAIGTVTRYELQHDTNSGFTAPFIVYSGTALTSNIPVTQDGTYSYRVRACNDSGCSNYQTGANGVVVTGPPGVPSSITIPATSATGTYTISWGTASGTVTRYELVSPINTLVCSRPRGSPPGSPTTCRWVTLFRNIYTGPATSFLVTGKTTGTYLYQVRACNNVTCSDYRVGTNGVVVTIQ